MKKIRAGTQIVFKGKTYVVALAVKADFNPYLIQVLLVENTKRDFLYRCYDTDKDIFISFLNIRDKDWNFAKKDIEEKVVKGWILKNQITGKLLDLDCENLNIAIPAKKEELKDLETYTWYLPIERKYYLVAYYKGYLYRVNTAFETLNKKEKVEQLRSIVKQDYFISVFAYIIRK